jgi:mannitol/fructose-specific phosphotransferase system IIA component (Ntr-type)
MSTLADSLHAKDIHLRMKASVTRDGIEELLSPLRGDTRVRDWERMRSDLQEAFADDQFGASSSNVFFHHVRTESVTGLVLAAGRSDEAPSGSDPVNGEKAKLVFVVVIPSALNNEYLRVLGAISRVCRETETLDQLLNAGDPHAFLAVMEKGCRQ